MGLYYTDYDELMERMLKRVPEDIDKREGSLIYTCYSAAATQMAMLSIQLEDLYNNAYVDTAEGEYLDRLVSFVGTERLAATKAVVKVEADAQLEIGSAFSGNGYKYVITQICDGYYLAECDTAGTEPNSLIGELTPDEDIEGLGSVSITKIVAEGKDEEDDESLRERFYNRARYPVCAGNLNYYREALKEMSGVGGVKILPAANGGGTVRLIITDTEYRQPSEELISYVQQQIDPIETSGQGFGIAPIGHKVKVEGAQEVDIEVTLRVTLEGGDPATAFVRRARAALPGLFIEENKTWAGKDKIVLRDSFFENYFLQFSDLIDDVEILSINGEENRLILQENQILGEVTVIDNV